MAAAAEPREKKRVLIIQPDELATADRLGSWLEESGLETIVIRPYLGEEVPTQAMADGLVVLGGHMGTMDGDEFPWLQKIQTLLADSVERSIPTLGVCLGAQLLAVSLGGDVDKGDAGLESGIVDVRWLQPAAEDRLVGALDNAFVAASMHFDAITKLPDEAVLLATGDMYPNQVFRIGSAWGVQFHPEVSPESFAGWREELPESLWEKFDEDVRVFEATDGSVLAGNRELAQRFSEIVLDN